MPEFVVYSCMHFTGAYHMAGFDITTAESGDSVCYVLLPEGAVPDMVKWAEKTPFFGNARLHLSLGVKE